MSTTSFHRAALPLTCLLATVLAAGCIPVETGGDQDLAPVANTNDNPNTNSAGDQNANSDGEGSANDNDNANANQPEDNSNDNTTPGEGDDDLATPDPGDVVGSVFAVRETMLEPADPDDATSVDTETDSLTAGGQFFATSPLLFDDVSFSYPGLENEVAEFDECRVTTTTLSTTSDLPTLGPGVGPLDAGEAGSLTNGTRTVDLLRGDPEDFDPPLLSLAGNYQADPDDGPLLDLGFDTGQTLTFTFPGGEDLGPFNASLEVPPLPVVTMPDLADPDLTWKSSGSLALLWEPGDRGDSLMVMLAAIENEDTDNPDGTTTTTQTRVQMQCVFPDTGSATIPEEVISQVPTDVGSVYIQVGWVERGEVSVPLVRQGGTGRIQVGGYTARSRELEIE